tara:strand:+ start:288 stop:530 length:243 start_codon:yes stop_codon:yes gene_type:complete
MTKRGKVLSLLSGCNGKPKKNIVKRSRTCHRCKSKMVKDQTCYEIPKTGLGFSKARPYCKNCFDDVIQQTQKELDELKGL